MPGKIPAGEFYRLATRKFLAPQAGMQNPWPYSADSGPGEVGDYFPGISRMLRMRISCLTTDFC